MIERYLALALVLGGAVAQNPNKGAWYENAVVYQIYPRSFQDSNGDGIGDLRGILHHVDYLADLGIDAIWLNPIYPSPDKDFGYDISDYTAINKLYGTMEDFKDLMGALKNKSIRLIMDYVPNHTSDEHDWFKKSVKRVDPYTNYYVWYTPADPSNPQPPNNWTSCFNGSMWEYHPERKEFYLHQFLKYQPDLNYRSPEVVQEMRNVLTFWMDKGVDGFRMDAVFALIEDDSWMDEPYIGGPTYSYDSYNHTMTAEQPQTFDTLRKFRETLDDYRRRDNVTKIMMTESYNTQWSDIQMYYGSPSKPISTFPFNFFWITEGTLSSTAADWAKLINDWYSQAMPSGSWAQPNFVLGNHDKHRFASRLTPEHTDIMNMLQLTLNGTAVVYYGDEIGLQDSWVRRDQGWDPVGTNSSKGEFMAASRDPERAPMPWNSTWNGGFTSNKTAWLPLVGNYWNVNVANQTDNKTLSHLQVFKQLIQLRKDSNMTMRACEVEAIGNALVVYRVLMDNPTIITVINLSFMQETVDLSKSRPSLPPKLQVKIKSVNYQRINEGRNMTVTTEVQTNQIVLPPLTGLVLTTY